VVCTSMCGRVVVERVECEDGWRLRALGPTVQCEHEACASLSHLPTLSGPLEASDRDSTGLPSLVMHSTAERPGSCLPPPVRVIVDDARERFRGAAGFLDFLCAVLLDVAFRGRLELPDMVVWGWDGVLVFVGV
jgi:hypothetical protein